MSKTQGELENFVRDMIESHDGEMPASWIPKAVVSTWEAPGCVDGDWFVLCAMQHVRATVRRVVRSYRIDADEPAQTRFSGNGFDKLQSRYLVTRDGEQAIVPTEMLSSSECRQKIKEMRAMRAGLATHIAEMERYLNEVVVPREAA